MFVLVSSLLVFAAMSLALAAFSESGFKLFQVESDFVSQVSADDAYAFAVAVVVLLFFRHRFGIWRVPTTPPEGFPPNARPRSFTTSVRFEAWAFFYGLLVALLFLGTVHFPDVAGKLLTIASTALGQIQGTAPAIPAATPGEVAAGSAASGPSLNAAELPRGLTFGIVLTVFFAGSKWEGYLREFFQTRAMIPDAATDIYASLQKTIWDSRPLPADLKAFLAYSGEAARIPDERGRPAGPLKAYRGEFIPSTKQRKQRALELLPRLEFVVWQLREREFSPEIQAELADHDRELIEIEEQLAHLRKTALGYNDELHKLVQGLIAVERAVHGKRESGPPAVVLRLSREAGVAEDVIQSGALPVSRIDDMAAALKRELTGLSERLKRENADQAGELRAVFRAAMGPADATAAPAREDLREDGAAYDAGRPRGRSELLRGLQARIRSLTAQIEALNTGLIPPSHARLDALEDALGGHFKELEVLRDKTLGLVVNLAMCHPVRPDRRFFNRLGLDPRLPEVRFKPNKALVALALPLVLYLSYFGVMQSPELREAAQARFDTLRGGATALFGAADAPVLGRVAEVAGATPETAVAATDVMAPPMGVATGTAGIEPKGSRELILWITIGTWFLAGSILQGCYHGSTLAQMRHHGVHEGRKPREFSPLDGLKAWIVSGSVLLLGLYTVVLGTGMTVLAINAAEMHTIFMAAAKYVLVPGVWAVVCAAATMRAFLQITPILRWWEGAMALAGIGLLLALIAATTPDPRLREGIYFEQMPLALALTLALIVGVRWSLTAKEQAKLEGYGETLSADPAPAPAG